MSEKKPTLIQIQLYIEPKILKPDEIQSNLSCHKLIKIYSYAGGSGLRCVGYLVTRNLSCDSLHCIFLGKTENSNCSQIPSTN